MHLKAITLKGFKSFPDRTRLEFSPGVSVVVGPNGSGKSNITDAVLWALGEQSPLAVRGQSMQDVIFAGAPGRQAARGAEVELVLDDAAGELGLGVPEVSILRRVDRTGEGEYRLAGARCRLVDVIEALSDTGLGKEMHSVISQGRVESLVSARPRERRMLIEEAAGLGKHRKRRRRAQLKLLRTQENLHRALDVEREARSRLRPLKRQAEAAELHARLERQTLEARWELVRDDVRAAEEALAHALQLAETARAGHEQVEGELAAMASRRDRAEQALARRGAEREELTRRCFAAQSALERVGYRVEGVRAAAAALDARLARTRALLETVPDDPPDATDPEASRRVAELERELAALERDRDAELARQLEVLERQQHLARTQTEQRTRAAEEAARARERAVELRDGARRRVRDAERGAESARRAAARVGGELAAVNQFLRSQAPVPGAAASLAEQLEVDAGYELALSAALDGRLRAAVVPDRAAANSLLDGAGEQGGCALIADGAAATAAAADGAAPPSPGAQQLADHVRGPDQAGALARALLREIWVVDELEVLPDEFSGVAVTREGRVFSAAAREVRQAPAAGEERILAQRNRREQLIRASEQAAGEELAAVAEVERAGQTLAGAEAEFERALAEHRAAVAARDEAAEEERRLASQVQRRRLAPDEGPGAARRAQLAAVLTAERTLAERADRDRRERLARLEQLRSAIVRDEALVIPVAEVLAALEEAAAAIDGRRSVFGAALSADRAAGEQTAAELRECAQREAELHARLHRANEAVTEAEVRLQRLRDELSDSRDELAQLAARLELPGEAAPEPLTATERQSLDERLDRLARRREQLGPVNPLAQEEYADAVAHVEELERQRDDLEAALRELQRLIADTDRQIRETFERTFAAAARNFEDVVAQLFPGGSGRLRLVTEREGAPRVLGGESANGASATHADVPDDGPEAGEEQPAEEDLLGVEIEVTPGGKAMKRLSLLSGGEKSLTALAFLFSVFLARPCPFYILDEVEAALDDLNIDRFLSLLRRYSQQAQFIVVTHQRRTMEAADSLYGVSMGADGISKVLSRRLPQEGPGAGGGARAAPAARGPADERPERAQHPGAASA